MVATGEPGNRNDTVRVLIGTPTFEYHQHCIDEFIAALQIQCEQRFDLMLVDNSPDPDYATTLREKGLPVFRSPFHTRMRERMTIARNLIREVFLRGAYSHLLFLDQDVILPSNGLARLLRHRLPLISGVYCKDCAYERYAMVVLPGWQHQSSGIKVVPLTRLEGQGLVEVEAAGFGCLLIERHVSEQIPFRYELKGNSDADLIFSADARQRGYHIYCDTDLRCAHRYIIRDFDRHPEWGEW